MCASSKARPAMAALAQTLAPPPPTPPTPENPWAKIPDYGNNIVSTMSLPNNGLGTIESIQSSSRSAEAPELGSPLGLESQRVKREKARLTIAA